MSHTHPLAEDREWSDGSAGEWRPIALAERLIKMFSFAGDSVLDPFAGTGTTALAAISCGRNSISVEIEPKYVEIAEQRLREAAWLPREAGAIEAKLVCK